MAPSALAFGLLFIVVIHFQLEIDVSAEDIDGHSERLRPEDAVQTHSYGWGYRWPNGTIVYELDNAFSDAQRELILEAQTQITNATESCITFREKSKNDTRYLNITTGRVCAAEYGWLPDRNTEMELGDHCFKIGSGWAEAARRFMVSLGMWYEHCREDRDKYVCINFDLLDPRYIPSFKIVKGITFGLPYDYESLMHPDEYFGSKYWVWLPCIVPRNESAIIGQRQYVSRLDALKLKRLYGCK